MAPPHRKQSIDLQFIGRFLSETNTGVKQYIFYFRRASIMLSFKLLEPPFFFFVGFFSQAFKSHRTAGEGERHFFKSSLLLPPASQRRKHQLGDYCRELTSAHSEQPCSNREPLASERKLLTTKLRALRATVMERSCKNNKMKCNLFVYSFVTLTCFSHM